MKYGGTPVVFGLVFALVISLGPQKTEAGFFNDVQSFTALAFCSVFTSLCERSPEEVIAQVPEKQELVVYSTLDTQEIPTPQMAYATTVIERIIVREVATPTEVVNKYFTYRYNNIEDNLGSVLEKAKAFTNTAAGRHYDRNHDNLKSLGDFVDTTFNVGDILYASADGKNMAALAVGTNGQVLTMNNGVPTWISGGGGGSIGSGQVGYIPYYASDGTALTATSSIFIDTNGNVGIGTTTPQEALYVQGNGNTITLNGLGGKPTFSFAQDGIPAANLSTALDGINGYMLKFGTKNDGGLETNKAVLTQDGKFGIGTTSPVAKLAVDGDFALTGEFYDSSNSAGSNGMVLQTTGAGTQWVATSTLGLGGGGGGGTFLSLSDTPGSFNADRVTFTNSGGTALTDSPSFTYDGLDLSVSGGYKIGSNIVLSASTTNFSTLVGANAGPDLLPDGFYNTAIGYQALFVATSSDGNTAVGRRALYSNTTGNNNTAVGILALNSNKSGINNIAGGMSALHFNASGNYNTAYGVHALYSNETADNNTAIGVSSLYSNKKGTENTAVGMNALYYNTSATGTVAIGYEAGTGSGTYGAGELTIVGAEALSNIDTGAEDITALGYRAGYANTTGANNIYIGYQAGDNITTGSNNIILGYDIDADSITDSNQLNIGDTIYGDLSTGDVGVGTSSPTAQLHTTGSVRFETFGAGAVTTDANGNLIVSSDERLKVIEGEYSASGIQELLGIEPIQYRWRESTGFDTETLYTGFSAQNVQEFIPEAVGEDKRGFLTLSDRPLLATVINAVKEIWESLNANEELDGEQQDRIQELEEQNSLLEERLQTVEEELEIDPPVVQIEIIDTTPDSEPADTTPPDSTDEDTDPVTESTDTTPEPVPEETEILTDPDNVEEVVPEESTTDQVPEESESVVEETAPEIIE